MFPVIFLVFDTAANSREQKSGAPYVFCRGDWYAQGNHARDAAKPSPAGRDGNTPSVGRDVCIQQSFTVPSLSNDYQSFDRRQWNCTTFPWDIQAAKYAYANKTKSVTVE